MSSICNKANQASESEHYCLKNGLEVYLLQDMTDSAVSVYIGYKVGSRNEHIGKTGMSHLLEHLLFRGTKKYPEEKLNNILYRSGADYNAFTSYDLTVYYETLPPKYLEMALEIEADRMTNSELSEEAVEKEKQIVISELEGGRNNPSSILDEELMNMHFRSHSYRWPVIGFKSDILSITREEIHSYYKTQYVPDNAILCIGGNFNSGEAKKLIEKHFGTKQPGGNIPTPSAKEPVHESMVSVNMEDPGKTSYMEYIFNSDKICGEDIYALKALDTVLCSGKSSRLYKALVKSGIASSAGTYVWESMDPGVMTVSLSLSADTEPQEAERILFEEIEKIQKDRISEKELEKAKNYLKAGFLQSKESVSDLALSIVYYGILGNSSYVKNFEKNIDSVTAEQIQEAAKKYLTTKNCTKGYMKASGRDAAFLRQIHALRAERGYKASAADSLDFSFDRFTLKNGVTVIVKRNHNIHSVTISGYIKHSGSYMDPEGKEGLASLTASMLERGTASKTYEEISEIKDFNAFTAGFVSKSEKTSIHGWMLRSKTETGISLAAEMLTTPSFSKEELEKCIKQRLDMIDYQNSDPHARALEELVRKIYPDGDRRAHIGTGTRESVSSITREDMIKFHKGCYRPENTVIILYGNISTEEAKDLTEKHFGSWEAEGEAFLPPAPKRRDSTASNSFINIEGKSQSSILMGSYGAGVYEKDYCAFRVFNQILGASALTSRLGTEIRVKKGLVYGINSMNSPHMNPPIFYISAGAAPDNTDEVIASTKQVLEEMLSEGITEQEFDDAKEHALNAMLVSLGDSDAQILMLERMEYFGFGKDYVKEYIKEHESLTIEDINMAGRKYLNPDSITSIVAGSKK